MFFRVYSGLRRKKNRAKQRSRKQKGSENRRSRETKKQKNREAKKQEETEKQKSRETKIESKKHRKEYFSMGGCSLRSKQLPQRAYVGIS